MKKIKIILPILLILIAVAGAAVYILSTGKLAVTPKAKVGVGLSKTLNTFEESEGVMSQTNYKILENLKGKAYETDVTMSVDVNVEDLEELVGDKDTANLINNIFDTIAETTISTKMAVDPNEELATLELGLKNEELIGEISGDIAISADEIAFRSKELNEDYLVLKKEDVEDEPEMEQIFEMLQQIIKMDYTALMFTDEEIKHFSDTYGKILPDSIKDDMITSDKSEFTVSGSKQACTKTVLTYNNDQFKELLKNYITTFENDKKGREILENKVSAIYGETLTEEFVSEMDSAIEELSDVIDEITNTKLEFVTYGTTTKTFGTETIVTIDEESAIIRETFNDDATNIVFDILGEEVANIVVKQSKDNISVEYTMDVEEIKATVKFAMNKNKMEASFDFEEDGETVGKAELTMNLDTKTNSEKELDQGVDMNFAFEIPVGTENLKGSFAIKADEKIAVLDSVKFPDTSKAISVLEQTDLEKYVKDAEEAAADYLEKIQENDLVNDIIDLTSKASVTTPSTSKDILNDLDDIDTTIDDSVLTVKPEDLESDIKIWYTGLVDEDGLKKSEIIEDEMISEMNFDDIVDVETYISWEEGEATDKGYVGIGVTDSEDNSYEFYIDIEKDIIYTEDTVTFDTEAIEWNEF